jgi:hypothetical protein
MEWINKQRFGIIELAVIDITQTKFDYKRNLKIADFW